MFRNSSSEEGGWVISQRTGIENISKGSINKYKGYAHAWATQRCFYRVILKKMEHLLNIFILALNDFHIGRRALDETAEVREILARGSLVSYSND